MHGQHSGLRKPEGSITSGTLVAISARRGASRGRSPYCWASTGLGRVQLDLDGLLGLGHFERRAEGLIARRDHLDPDIALGKLGDLRHAFLVGPDLPARDNLLAQLRDRARTGEGTTTLARSSGLPARS